MRRSEGLWQNAAGEGIVGVDRIVGFDDAVLCVETVVYWAQIDQDRYTCKENALNAQ